MSVDTEPGFVEITVHPADGGRVGAEPSATPDPTPLPSGSIEILTHCGLGSVRIEHEGVLWRFVVGDQGNPPAGWGFNTTVVQLKPGPEWAHRHRAGRLGVAAHPCGPRPISRDLFVGLALSRPVDQVFGNRSAAWRTRSAGSASERELIGLEQVDHAALVAADGDDGVAKRHEG